VSDMLALAPSDLDFSEAYVDGDATARWESAPGHSPSAGAQASGSSVLRVGAGCRLPRHTDSAEETVVVVAGEAEIEVADQRARVSAGGLAVIPKEVPHEVRNAGGETLLFVAVYAEPDVVTRYEQVIQPDGSRERHTVS